MTLKSNLEVARIKVGVDRRGSGFSKSEIAESAKVHVNTVSKIEKGDNLETKQIGPLLQIADALGIELIKRPNQTDDYYLLEIIEE